MDWRSFNSFIVWGADILDDEEDQQNSAIAKLKVFLEKENRWKNVLFLVDKNTHKHGLSCLGKEIFAPERIKEAPNALIIINSPVSMLDIYAEIKKLDLPNEVCVVPCYYYHRYIGSHYDYDYAKSFTEKKWEEVTSLYEITDKQTKFTLDIMKYLRLKAEDDLYPMDFYGDLGIRQHYFCDTELAPTGKITYVDVGAYTGDSIAPVFDFFDGRLAHIIAFEPSKTSIAELKDYLSQNGLLSKTDIYDCMLGSQEQEVRFSYNTFNTRVSSEGEEVAFVKKFDNLSDIKVIGDLCIKMDIEGSEMEALNGMEETIKKYEPYLAICIYHKIEDIYDIPLYLKKLVPSYRFFIRGGLHLECIAVPQRHYNPLNTDILSKLRDIFRDVLGNEELEISLETKADSISGWDSLAHISILVAVQEEFSISFDIDEILKLKDVKDIVNAVQEKKMA